MIKECTDWMNDDEIETWCERVQQELLKTSYPSEDGWLSSHFLHINQMGDDGFYVTIDGEELAIELDEETYDTSDFRDENIKFIKMFVERELPYFKFDKMKKPVDSEYGFRLYFKLEVKE